MILNLELLWSMFSMGHKTSYKLWYFNLRQAFVLAKDTGDHEESFPYTYTKCLTKAPKTSLSIHSAQYKVISLGCFLSIADTLCTKLVHLQELLTKHDLNHHDQRIIISVSHQHEVKQLLTKADIMWLCGCLSVYSISMLNNESTRLTLIFGRFKQPDKYL